MTDRGTRSMGWHVGLYGALAVAMFVVASACVANEPALGKLGPNAENDPPAAPDPPEPVKKCPPDSYTYTNLGPGARTLSFSCSDNTGGSVGVPVGGSVTFEASCPVGEPGEPAGRCIECALIALRDPTTVFSCEVQAVYLEAYGLDLAAEGFTATEDNRPKKIYDANGDPIRMPQWAIPIVDANGELVDWEFTTIKPSFSVEDGEVVIRDNRDRVFGGREGITLND